MPLTDFGHDPVMSGAAHFYMKDHTGKRHAIWVTQELLENIGAAGGAYREVFEQNRPQFIHIASRKFDAAQLEQDGSVWVRSSDW